MNKTPIHEVIRRIRPLAPIHKAAFLRGLIASEPKRSMRRQELQRALQHVVNRQLGIEIKQDNRRRA